MTAGTYDQRRHLDELLPAAPASIERMAWDADRLRAWQDRRLGDLLEHAADHSRFHRERLRGIDLRHVTVADLCHLPTMDKQALMERFEDVVTDARLTRDAVESHVAAAPRSLDYLFGRYVVMCSGGSSGVRGTFVYDAPEFTEFALSLVRGTLARLAALGVTPDAPVPGAVVAAGATVHGTGAVGALAGGPGAPVAMHRVPATLPFTVVVERLEAIQPLVLVGYASVLVRLAAAKRAGRLDIAPVAIGSTSEPLPAAARAAVEEAFGVPMTDTFGSSEGLCGVSEPGEAEIAFATDSCIVELVDDRDRPVAPGTVAAKALVTNLYNRTQPLIRYELTDRFVESPGPHPDGRLRALVDGRHDAPLTYGDVVVHPLVVRAALGRDHTVVEHQVRQTPAGIDVRIVSTGGTDLAGLADALTSALRSAGLADPQVDVTQVDAIERDAVTGKARRFIPR
jgi:phenylacetate-coenzyme A ligase PaaK-like adenylate-forming protein